MRFIEFIRKIKRKRYMKNLLKMDDKKLMAISFCDQEMERLKGWIDMYTAEYASFQQMREELIND